MPDEEFKQMIIDHMEKGFLENIIVMIKQDSSLYSIIPEMLSSEKLRVRIGTMSLIEELIESNSDNLVKIIPEIGELLKNQSPTIRGDVIQALEIIGDPQAISYLNLVLHDSNQEIRSYAEEVFLKLSKM